MCRVEAKQSVGLSVSVEVDARVGVAAGGCSLLPAAEAIGMDVATAIATLVMQNGLARRDRQSEAARISDTRARSAEDRAVNEMHRKAEQLRTDAYVSGALTFTGGAVSLGGALTSGRPGEVAKSAGKGTSDLAGTLQGLSNAGSASRDAAIKAHENRGARCRRDEEHAREDVRAVRESIERIVAALRDILRTRSDTLLAVSRF